MKALILIFILPMSLWAARGGGTDIGNGGDLVKCSPYQANQLFGFYSLDYLVQSRQSESMPAEVKSWQESIYNIRRNIVDKIPELLPIFDEYVNDIMNQDQSRRHVWEPTDYQLTEINDEDLPLAIEIPVNCRENGKLQLVQAVIRQNPTFTGSKLIVYKYMPKIFEKMENEKPLQLSFLLIHEFLWSISDNVDRNRRINWFLHSADFQKLSRLDVIDRLLGMGLNIKEIPRILDASGRGHFTTLQDALSKIRANETLIVKEGVYSTGGAAIISPMKMIGQGDKSKIIIKGTKTYAALDVALEDDQLLEIQNVTISRDAQTFVYDGDSSTIEFTSGKLSIKDSNLLGNNVHQLITLTGHSSLNLDKVTLDWYDHGIDFHDFKGTVRINESLFNTPGRNFSAAIYIYDSLVFKGEFTNNTFRGVDGYVNERGDGPITSSLEGMFSNNLCPELKGASSPFCTKPK